MWSAKEIKNLHISAIVKAEAGESILTTTLPKCDLINHANRRGNDDKSTKRDHLYHCVWLGLCYGIEAYFIIAGNRPTALRVLISDCSRGRAVIEHF
jgi:hypothetical protein